MSFSFFLDDNGFTSPLAPFPPIVGTGNLTLASSLGDGTYTLASLPSFTLSFALVDGDTYTQADIISDPTQSEVVIYNNGQNAYFSDIMPSNIVGGSLDLANSNGLLSFSPASFGVGFFFEDSDSGELIGNYGNSVVPEPSSLTLAGIAGLTGAITAVIRRRRKAKAPTTV
jgi:PEP-CTERM motif